MSNYWLDKKEEREQINHIIVNPQLWTQGSKNFYYFTDIPLDFDKDYIPSSVTITLKS